jgi:protein ImuA
MAQRQQHVVDALRRRLQEIERGGRPRAGVLPFNLAALDGYLPEGGLPLGALHEVGGDGEGSDDGVLPALFIAGLLARRPGPVLWCLPPVPPGARNAGLFAPGIAQAGLHPDRVIYVEAQAEATLLAALEEGLRHGGLAGVVGELPRLGMTVSRRLQLAAEATASLALLLLRAKPAVLETEITRPTAAATRWRISPLPSPSALDTPAAPGQPGIGLARARWRVELLRCRGAEPKSWEMEACDAQGRLALPAGLADGPATAPAWNRRAAAG